MNVNVLFRLLFIILFVSFSGCQQYTTKKRINNIEAAITNYGVAMRWGQYTEVYNYHVSPKGTKPSADLDILKELSVTGVKVMEKIINKEQTEAIVKTEISYFFKDQGTIKKIKLTHKWWINEETNQWFIDGEFPEFK